MSRKTEARKGADFSLRRGPTIKEEQSENLNFLNAMGWELP